MRNGCGNKFNSFQDTETDRLMRKFGAIRDEIDAKRLIDYLLTQRIVAVMDVAADPRDGWELWVREEDQFDSAKQILAEFREAPGDPRFEATAAANEIRKRQSQDLQRRAKLQQTMPRGGLGSMMSRQIPLTIGFIILAAIVSLITKFGDVSVMRSERINADGEIVFQFENTTASAVYRALMLVDPFEYRPDYKRPSLGNKDPLARLKRGELWRLVTPVLLHGNIMHLAFNMLAMYSLGGIIERLHGKWFLLAAILFTGAVGSLVQALVPPSLGGTPIALGASGAIFGLFGYLWVRPMLEPMYPIRIPRGSVVMILGWMFLCMTPLIPGIANAAHVGGLLAGMTIVPLAIRFWPPS